MLIGIDASRANMKQRTGVEWYGYHVIRELAKLDTSHEYRLYTWEPLRDDLAHLPPNFTNVIVPNRRFWTYTALANELRKNPVERLFIPSHIVPPVHPEHTVVSIHDLGFRHFRENYSTYHYLNLHLGTRLSARWAKKILVLSQEVGRDIEQYYPGARGKIEVAPAGFDRAMYQGLTPRRVAETMRKYHIDDPYLLFLGRLEVRKNVVRLIEAYYRLRDSGLFGGQLVLAGNPGEGYQEIRAMMAKRGGEGIVQPGWVEDADRAALLRGARALVFPSLYEGFGIPILEAFAADTPVLTSRGGATEEVAGEAAVLVDPRNVDEIHHGMEALLSDEQLVSRLTEAGRQRTERFGWDQTARHIHQVLTA